MFLHVSVILSTRRGSASAGGLPWGITLAGDGAVSSGYASRGCASGGDLLLKKVCMGVGWLNPEGCHPELLRSDGITR